MTQVGGVQLGKTYVITAKFIITSTSVGSSVVGWSWEECKFYYSFKMFHFLTCLMV